MFLETFGEGITMGASLEMQVGMRDGATTKVAGPGPQEDGKGFLHGNRGDFISCVSRRSAERRTSLHILR